MVNLEEGVVKNWSWGRLVLVGDAAHKFTPSTGGGCNNGIIDVAALLNELFQAVEVADARNTGAAPSAQELASAFKAYQSVRYNTVVGACAASGKATSTAAWETFMFKFVDQWVMGNHMFMKMFMDRKAGAVARTPVLNFVEFEEKMQGEVPWVQPVRPEPVTA
jgi:2-polyprenyl-6-methoxyphenol hydroxylase-like FAD-dependent oxidoreductase